MATDADILDQLGNELGALRTERVRCDADALTAKGQLAAELRALSREFGVESVDVGRALADQLAQQIAEVGTHVRKQIADLRERLDAGGAR